MRFFARIVAVLAMALVQLGCVHGPEKPTTSRTPEELGDLARAAMHKTGARGLAIALIDNGAVSRIGAYGVRNAAGDPLTPDTIMYGASLTKAVFAFMTLQLVEEGKLKLDTPITSLLPEPLPSYNSAADQRAYGNWGDLVGDARWRAITPRHVLNHATGFANFAFLEPDKKLKFHFDPGARYAYSGEGIMLLQFGLERGLALNVKTEMEQRIFKPLGMTRTSLVWREDFAANLADGFGADGAVTEHDRRSRPRAAGSMDTTIADMAKLAAAMARRWNVPDGSARITDAPLLPITTQSQFPTLRAPPQEPPFKNLAAGLGVTVFDGPQGRGFYKGGHNDVTGNTMVCLERGQRCVVILANDVRAEAAFPAIVAAMLGETGLPWRWEYGDMKFWDGQ